MGAASSSTFTFSHDLRTPTRSLSTRLELPSKASPTSFAFSQEMKKGVGEEQTLVTRVHYTGRMEEVSQDVTDARGAVVKGNPLYLLHTERVAFEVEWGSEWYQCKKGRLVREDLLKAEKDAAAVGGAKKRKCTPIVTSTTPPPHRHLHSTISTAPTVPPSPSSSNSSSSSSSSSASSTRVAAPNGAGLPPLFPSLALPPAADSLQRGFSHSAPLSPAPLSLSERQRSHIDTETGLGERPVQAVTSDKGKASSSASSSSAASSASSPAASASSSPSSPLSSLDPVAATKSSFLHPSLPRSIAITFNGRFHSALQQATSLEEMSDLLQQDASDWLGSFSSTALVLRVEVLSEEVRVEYFKPKFEYLWAQVQDECPIIMALSNVFHDHALNEMYLPRGKA